MKISVNHSTTEEVTIVQNIVPHLQFWYVIWYKWFVECIGASNRRDVGCRVSIYFGVNRDYVGIKGLVGR